MPLGGQFCIQVCPNITCLCLPHRSQEMPPLLKGCPGLCRNLAVRRKNTYGVGVELGSLPYTGTSTSTLANGSTKELTYSTVLLDLRHHNIVFCDVETDRVALLATSYRILRRRGPYFLIFIDAAGYTATVKRSAATAAPRRFLLVQKNLLHICNNLPLREFVNIK